MWESGLPAMAVCQARKYWLIHCHCGQARLPHGQAVCLSGWIAHEVSLGLSDIAYKSKRPGVFTFGSFRERVN